MEKLKVGVSLYDLKKVSFSGSTGNDVQMLSCRNIGELRHQPNVGVDCP